MALDDITRKNIGVIIHIIVPWSLLGPLKGALNNIYDPGDIKWMVFYVKLPKGIFSY